MLSPEDLKGLRARVLSKSGERRAAAAKFRSEPRRNRIVLAVGVGPVPCSQDFLSRRSEMVLADQVSGYRGVARRVKAAASSRAQVQMAGMRKSLAGGAGDPGGH